MVNFISQSAAAARLLKSAPPRARPVIVTKRVYLFMRGKLTARGGDGKNVPASDQAGHRTRARRADGRAIVERRDPGDSVSRHSEIFWIVHRCAVHRCPADTRGVLRV